MKTKTNSVLVIVEPMFNTVEYVHAANRKHYTVVVVSSDPAFAKRFGYENLVDEIHITDVQDGDQIYAALEHSKFKGKIDGLVPGSEQTLLSASSAARRLGLKALSLQTTQQLTSKYLAREAYVRSGLRCPKYAKVDNCAAALSAISSIGYPVILKPTDGCSSINVFLAKGPADVKAAFAVYDAVEYSILNFKSQRQILIEEFLRGEEYSIEILVAEGQALFAEVTEKKTGAPGHFVELAHTSPAPLTDEMATAISGAAVAGLKAVNFTDGAAHVEVMLTANGPVIIEANPRPGGDMIAQELVPHAFGINLYAEMVDLYLGIKTVPKKTKYQAAAIVYFVSDFDGTIEKITGIESLKANTDIVKFEIYNNVGDKVFAPRDSGDRMGYVIAVGATPELAKAAAKKAVAGVLFKVSPSAKIYPKAS